MIAELEEEHVGSWRFGLFSKLRAISWSELSSQYKHFFEPSFVLRPRVETDDKEQQIHLEPTIDLI